MQFKIHSARIAFALFALLSSLGLQAQNVGIGTTAPIYKLHTIGDIYADGGWLRVSGNNGVYWETWTGGFYMSDPTWIRTYNDKNVWTGNGLLGAEGGLTVGFAGAAPLPGGAIVANNLSVGTSSQVQRVTVQGLVEIIDNFDNVLLSRNTVQNRAHHMIGTYMGWDQNAIYLGGYNANFPSALYSNANRIVCGGINGSLPIYATAFNTASSRSFKRDFEPINYGLNEVMALEPMKYFYNFEGDSVTRKHIGMIAEDVNQIVPEVVAMQDGKCLGMDYGALVPVLVKAMQEQQAMIVQQNAKIANLQAELEKLLGK